MIIWATDSRLATAVCLYDHIESCDWSGIYHVCVFWGGDAFTCQCSERIHHSFPQKRMKEQRKNLQFVFEWLIAKSFSFTFSGKT